MLFFISWLRINEWYKASMTSTECKLISVWPPQNTRFSHLSCNATSSYHCRSRIALVVLQCLIPHN